MWEDDLVPGSPARFGWFSGAAAVPFCMLHFQASVLGLSASRWRSD